MAKEIVITRIGGQLRGIAQECDFDMAQIKKKVRFAMDSEDGGSPDWVSFKNGVVVEVPNGNGDRAHLAERIFDKKTGLLAAEARCQVEPKLKDVKAAELVRSLEVVLKEKLAHWPRDIELDAIPLLDVRDGNSPFRTLDQVVEAGQLHEQPLVLGEQCPPESVEQFLGKIGQYVGELQQFCRDHADALDPREWFWRVGSVKNENCFGQVYMQRHGAVPSLPVSVLVYKSNRGFRYLFALEDDAYQLQQRLREELVATIEADDLDDGEELTHEDIRAIRARVKVQNAALTVQFCHWMKFVWFERGRRQKEMPKKAASAQQVSAFNQRFGQAKKQNGQGKRKKGQERKAA